MFLTECEECGQPKRDHGPWENRCKCDNTQPNETITFLRLLIRYLLRRVEERRGTATPEELYDSTDQRQLRGYRKSLDSSLGSQRQNDPSKPCFYCSEVRNCLCKYPGATNDGVNDLFERISKLKSSDLRGAAKQKIDEELAMVVEILKRKQRVRLHETFGRNVW